MTQAKEGEELREALRGIASQFEDMGKKVTTQLTKKEKQVEGLKKRLEDQTKLNEKEVCMRDGPRILNCMHDL